MKKYFESIKECRRFLEDLVEKTSQLEVAGDKDAVMWRQMVLITGEDTIRILKNFERDKDATIIENMLQHLYHLFDYWYPGQRLFRLEDKTEVRDRIRQMIDFLEL